ncbi:MAG: hypothetical protein Q9188_000150 [Gyalolechia gomerana]
MGQVSGGKLEQNNRGRSAYAPLESEVLPTESGELVQVPPEEVERQGLHTGILDYASPEPGSSLYVQQFDDRGHPQNPASRELSRASRRAQNDVLASVGYLAVSDQSIPGPTVVPTTAYSRTRDQLYEETRDDTENGELIAFGYGLASSLIHDRFTYLRNRLQVESPKRIDHVPLPKLLKVEWANSDPLLLLFGGLAGDLLVVLSARAPPHNLAHRLFHGLVDRRIAEVKLPSLRYLSSLPEDLKIASIVHYLASLACSPVILYYALRTARTVTQWKAFEYFELALPKPDNPDRTSINLALHRGEDANFVPGLNFRLDEETRLPVKEVRTVRELAQKDWAAFSNRVASMALWCQSIFMRDTNSSISYLSPNLQKREDRPASASPRPSEPSQEQEMLEQINSSSPQPVEGRLVQPSEELSLPVIRSQDASSSSGGTIAQDPFRELHELHDDSRPTHRVTRLTNIMTRTMAAHLSIVFTNALYLPLEALFVRSVASAYLSTTGGVSESSLWLRNEIYPLGSWFGMGWGKGRAMDYARKMTLCLGMQMALGYGVWQIGAGATWWLGKSMHGWGRL